jgi:pyruvate ferredoxin oxidoreductase alpha subunit
LEQIPVLAADFAKVFGRQSGGLVRSYRTDDAETIIVALGSVLGTIKDAVDRRREVGDRVGVVGITTFRPFPGDAVREALAGARRVVVVEKAFSVGFGGVLSTDVALTIHDADCALRTIVAGLGGRPITRRSLEEMIAAAVRDELDPLTFLDLDHSVVERERARMSLARRSGPSAENMLRDLRTAPRIG